jgi:hypothetical protein
MRALVGAGSDGVTRAEATGGGWLVERVPLEQDVRCLSADPLREAVVWAGTQRAGLHRSDDAGRTWRFTGLDGATVTSVAPSPAEQGVVYVGTKPARVFVSRDDGATWSELESFHRIRGRRLWFSPAERPFVAYVQGLAVSPTDPDIVLAGIEFGAVVRSEDGGRTWSGHRGGASRDCHSLAFHPTDGRYVYEGGGTGPSMSRDAGLTWDADRTGMDRKYCWAVTADPADPETWYVSAAKGPRAAHGGGPADGRVLRRGGAWEAVGAFESMPYALFHDGVLHAGLGDGSVRRLEGESWSVLPLSMGAGVRCYAAVA